MEKEIKAPDWSDLYRGLEDEYRAVYSICPQCGELLELFTKAAKGGKEYNNVRFALWQTFKSKSNPYGFYWGTLEDVINMIRLVRHIRWGIAEDGQLSLAHLIYKNKLEVDDNKKVWDVHCYFMTAVPLGGLDNDSAYAATVDKLIDDSLLPLKCKWTLDTKLTHISLCNKWDLFMEIVRKLCDPEEVAGSTWCADNVLKQYVE